MMDKIAEYLEDAARRHNSKILYWHANKLRGSSQSAFMLVVDRNGATIGNKERVKERWAKHFENVLTETELQKKIKNEKPCGKLRCEGRSIFRGKIIDSTKRIKK